MNKKMKKVALWLNLTVFVVIASVYLNNSLQVLEFKLSDYNMKKTMTHDPHGDIVIIGIDEESIQTLGKFPWSRDVYIPVLEELGKPENKPKALAFDILFTNESDPEVDAMLAETLAKHDYIVLPSYADTENKFGRTTKMRKDAPMFSDKIVKPIPQFAEVSETALINRVVDPDGVVRRTWLQVETPEGLMPSLALKAARMYGADVDHFLNYRDPGQNPLSEITIKYDAETTDFFTIPFSAILNGDVPLDNFKDRIVLLGYTYVGTSDDNGIAPVENNMKLMYAHANIINQLIHNDHIVVIPPWISFILTFLMFFGFIALTWRIKPLITFFLFTLFAVLMLFGQFYLFKHYLIHVKVVYPMFALLLTFLMNIAVKSYFENTQKNFITKQFGRYISPDLVSQIASSDIEIKLGGDSKELTILFLDIRGFTTLSEKLKPEEVVDFLNTMFNMITRTALDNKGTIDKFIGDAAMILFNAPLDVEDHEYYAVKTAYEIQQGMQEIRNAIQDKYGVSVNIGIGINTGTVVVGNIGSYLRIDYTAIGDNVNIAARIESNTIANQILVSESTYERTKERFPFEFVGEKMVKGKSVPLKLYEVTGMPHDTEQAS